MLHEERGLHEIVVLVITLLANHNKQYNQYELHYMKIKNHESKNVKNNTILIFKQLMENQVINMINCKISIFFFLIHGY